MTLTMKQLPYIQTKLRYHSTAHFPYVDNDKDQCETNCETNVPVDSDWQRPNNSGKAWFQLVIGAWSG